MLPHARESETLSSVRSHGVHGAPPDEPRGVAARPADSLLLIGCSGGLERTIRDSSLGQCLRVQTLPVLSAPEFLTVVRGASLLVLQQAGPGETLVGICRQLRRQTHRPLVVLTGEPDEDLTVAVLGAGADDCLVAECSQAELVARLRAQLRRDREYSAVEQGVCYEFQGVRLDTGSHEVVARGQRLVLTPKEFALLEALATQAGRPVRREDLLREVWGYSPEIATRTLDVHVGRLRQKLELDAARPTLIITVPGVGYKLAPGP